MRFFVIYSIDVPRSESIKPFLPTQRHLFDQTEGDEQYEYGYLEDEWEKGKHRKLVAELTRKQFEKFLQDTNLYPETTETMGSLTGYGWLPAISFNGDDARAILNAYVTPIPEVNRKNGFTEHDFQRCKDAILSIYG